MPKLIVHSCDYPGCKETSTLDVSKYPHLEETKTPDDWTQGPETESNDWTPSYFCPKHNTKEEKVSTEADNQLNNSFKTSNRALIPGMEY
ncbi:MAG: hypothetical protein PF572_00355 [Patescibacteria group bacterium]|jgi:hypothetical protein|nr:hypothetical protein [Patescibacteria group bacterium]